MRSIVQPEKTSRSTDRCRRSGLLFAACLLALGLAGCAGTPPAQGPARPESRGATARGWSDLPVRLAAPPEAPWRPALPAGCRCPDGPRDAAARRALADAAELFRYGEGGDAIVALEMYLETRPAPDPLVLVTLGQLYVMAGWGDAVEPREGPAAATGDWPRDRRRYLARAQRLLARAAAELPDDAVCRYLMADAARAGGERAAADSLWHDALARCPCPATLAVMVRYRELGPHPPRQEGAVEPRFPESAARDGIRGNVVLDVLVAPDGRVRQVDVVDSPDRRLSRAAAAAFREARFVPGKVGKYPVWSWLRAEVAFR